MIGGLGTFLGGFFGPAFTMTQAPAYGVQSLRYASAIVGIVNVWSALHYVLGTRTLQADLAFAEA